MKFKVKEKFKSNNELDIEIISIRPGSQRNVINTNGVTYYGISLNGHITLISEPVLEILVKESNLVDKIVKKAKIDEIKSTPMINLPIEEDEGKMVMKGLIEKMENVNNKCRQEKEKDIISKTEERKEYKKRGPKPKNKF